MRHRNARVLAIFLGVYYLSWDTYDNLPLNVLFLPRECVHVTSSNCKEPLKVLSSSGISVYSFPAQCRPAFQIPRILNFKDIAFRDTKLRSLLSKNIYLSRDYQPFQELKYQKKSLCRQPKQAPDVYIIFQPPFGGLRRCFNMTAPQQAL